MNILDQIDEVVKESDELSDEVIEARAREHGLDHVPKNVTEVIDVLFGHIDPPMGGVRNEDDEEWSNWSNWASVTSIDTNQISTVTQTSRGRLMQENAETQRLLTRDMVSRSINWTAFARSIVGKNADQRAAGLRIWRLQAERSLKQFLNLQHISEAEYVEWLEVVERYAAEAAFVRHGESLPTGPGEVIHAGPDGIWWLTSQEV